MKQNGILDCFADFITSQHGFERKPSPDAINHLAEKHHMVRDEALMIGDRDLDILSAKNAGIYACYYKQGDERSVHADYTIDDFQQLYSILS